MHNLVSMNVVIGVVERMGDSMRMNQELNDQDVDQEEIKREIGYKNDVRKKLNDSKKNTKKGGSEKVHELLQNDKHFYNNFFLPFLEHDQEITNFALRLHMKQMEELDSSSK